MNKNLHIFWLFFISICFFSCEKVITVPLPEHKPQLVIYGFLNPTEEVSVKITHTVPVLESHSENLSVQNASVSLFEDGIFIENLTHDQDGIYISPSDYKPKLSKAYHFVVTAPEFDQIETNLERIPPLVDIPFRNFKDSVFEGFLNNVEGGIFSWKFQDRSNEEDFYGINILPFKSENEEAWAPNRLLGYSEEYGDICGLVSGRINYSFPEECVQGLESDTLRLAIATTYQTRRDSTEAFDYLEITLYHLSPAYYNYLSSLRQPEGLELAFASPSSLFTNVKGGYGVIGAFTTRNIRIDL